MTEKIIVGVTDLLVSRRAVDWAVARAVARRQSVELVHVIGGVMGSVGEGAVSVSRVRGRFVGSTDTPNSGSSASPSESASPRLP